MRNKVASVLALACVLAGASACKLGGDADTSVKGVHNAHTVVNENDSRVQQEQSRINEVTGQQP